MSHQFPALESPVATPSRLSAQELDFERLLDLLPGAFYLCDRDGTIIRYNRGAVELWGRAPVIGDPSERFCGSLRLYRLDGGPVPHAQCPMAQVLRTGVPVRNEEIVIERPDGTRIVALVNIDPLMNSAGEIIGAANCFRDITEHRHLKDLQRQTEQRSHELLGALPAAVYTTDAAGRITYYNEAAAELWGCRPELGKSEFCGSWKLYWPDGSPLPHDQCPMALALKEKRPIRGMEAIAERPDGRRVPFIPYPTPLFDEDGKLVGAVNMLVDITERRRAEESLLAEIEQRRRAERAARLSAFLVESSDDAIIGMDLNGIITSWNRGAERLYGYGVDEVIGRPVAILIPVDRLGDEPAILERIRRGERVDHYETLRRRKDGSLVDISLTVSPIQDDLGRIIGASKIARDITERRRAEERQELLLREMNHRIKNVFALASSLVALSAQSAQSPEHVISAVRERLSTLARAHDLTMPAISARGEEGDRSTTLEALIRTIVAPYDHSGDKGRVIMNGPDVPIAGSVVTSLALLIHEFATNAAKYGALSSVTGTVDIGWSADADKVVLIWKERGGPPLAGPPGDEGFGSLLARVTVKNELRGEISRDWQAEGLVIELAVPRDRLAG